jgi:hypothetical protein
LAQDSHGIDGEEGQRDDVMRFLISVVYMCMFLLAPLHALMPLELFVKEHKLRVQLQMTPHISLFNI